MQAIDQKRLYEYLDAFSVSTGVPVTLFTPDGSILEEFQAEKKFCHFFPIYRQPDSVCGSTMRFSAKSSYHLGEPYIFSCHAGLIHIAVPVVVSEKFCGCAVAGPLSMGPVSAELLTQAFEFNQISPELLAKISLFISSMRVYTPEQIQKFSLMLYSAVVHSHKNWDDYEQLRLRYQRQLTVGDHIQKRKQSKPRNTSAALSAPTCSDLEDRLAREIRGRNREAALTCLDDFFEELVLVEGGNFDSIKLHFFELYISLARMSTERGASLRNIFGLDFKFINSLNKLNTLDSLAQWSRGLVIHFVDDIFADLPQVSSATTRAVSYINAHYMDCLLYTSDAADEL